MREATIDRLSQQDLSNLRVEARGLPMTVAALLVLDGPFDSAALRRVLHQRLHRVERLRQVVYRPAFGLGRPIWVDDPLFDLDAHVHVVPVLGDERAFLDACIHATGTPLSPARPLWDIWLLEASHGEKVGVLVRLHHAVADGTAALALLDALFDGDAPPCALPPAWEPRPVPGRRALLADNLRERAASARAIGRTCAHPGATWHRLVAGVGALRDVVAEGRAARTSLTGRAGMRRRLMLERADLDRVRAVAHAHRATVNDVVLTAIAGGLRELLRARGALTAGLTVQVSVPVSLRDRGDARTKGNETAVMIVPLPIDVPDPVQRLEAVARSTASRKRRPHIAGSLTGSVVMQRVLIAAMHRQRVVHLFTSNVRGPVERRYLGGTAVRELFQIGVIQGNVLLGVGCVSYAGQLAFDVLADADAYPDLHVFVNGLRGTLDALEVGLVTVR